MSIKDYTAHQLSIIIDSLSEEDLKKSLEVPPNREMGDLAFPCFILAKHLKQSPVQIAKELEGKLSSSDVFDRVEATGPYLNLFLPKRKLTEQVISEILVDGEQYGSVKASGHQIPIDLSSPNIAKPFSMGHLRSTVIGNAVANLAEKNGYKPIRINHLGDWGTQFGKLMTAYEKWGNEHAVRKSPIKELNALYVLFHEKAKEDPSLDDEGRAWFKKLEGGDSNATALWKWFREESLKEFEKIYELLDVSFDAYPGESFYNDKMQAIVDELNEKKLLVESDGAMVVDLEEFDMPPALIQKKDGASLYATRDLAAAKYRKSTYHFAESLYVVGHEQSLHFQQVKKVLLKLGYDWAEDMKHIPFGMILQDGKKMSTRKGKTVLLEEVLKQTIEQAKRNIEEKNPTLKAKEQVAEIIGVGAVIFNDLKQSRLNDVEFDIEQMLRFEGETGPYIQYTYARACTLLTKGSWGEMKETNPPYNIDEAYLWDLILTLEHFPSIVERAFHEYEPSILSRYLIVLARYFNQYYGKVRILSGTDEEQQARLHLVKSVTVVLKEGLRLLGIKAPEKM
ncbi:arginine--tRNA ligase [Pseudalkalibacillus berkeleyi]|uniref:Arginine--tRNA ligase n=1 Tax=Pseudalkalibacillus berkeleyi TaxID=1069813 RepID=A0ABS9H6F9_9BACL|nr:arginine--tRNA ligase [Pseudalkalibacillus berkeleyi]MCF6139373.1 arginine--tRNA ligase [Pseudalkalibacillus berkeleyi]